MLQLRQQDRQMASAILSLAQTRNEFKLIDLTSEKRAEYEGFIRAGFAKAYDANLRSFMPLFVGINTSEIKAVLGIRPADQPLFVEQYLHSPIENYFSNGSFVSRGQIAEIGNLVSISRKHTPRLFLLTALSAIRSGYRYFTFTATRQLKTLLTSFGLSLRYLQEADGNKLGKAVRHWGSYYQTAPQILAIDLHEVLNLCTSSPVIRRMAKDINEHVFDLNV